MMALPIMNLAAVRPATSVIFSAALYLTAAQRILDVSRNCCNIVLDAQVELVRSIAELASNQVQTRSVARPSGDTSEERRKQSVLISFPDRRVAAA